MNDLQIFTYDGNPLRTIEKDGEIWWVLKDVCEVIGIRNHSNVVPRLDEDEKALHLVEDPNGKGQQTMRYRDAALLGKLDAIAADKKLRAIFEGVVRSYQARAVPPAEGGRL